MRLVTCAVLLTLAAGIAAACSAFIPFDEYAGPPVATAAEAGSDGATVDDGGPVSDGAVDCKDVDLKTDPNNCGACARRCDACDAGRCPLEILVDGTSAVTALHLGLRDPDAGSTAIYFVRGSGTLARVDLDGGRYEEALTQGAAPLSFGTTTGLVASKTDAITVFMRDRFLDAGAVQIVPPRNNLGPLLFEDRNVFWSDDDGMFWAAVKPDASVSQLSDASAVAITSAAGTSFWTDGSGLVQRMSTLAPDSLAPVLNVNGGASSVTGIAIGPKHIYLTQKSQGLLVYDYDGTTAKLARLAPVADPELVVCDQTHVYVYEAAPSLGQRELHRYDLDGQGKLVLSASLGAVRALALDATYLYFTDQVRVGRIVK